MTNKNDERILELRKQIASKRGKINSVGRFNPVTNCSLELDGERFNLNVLRVNELQKLLIKLTAYYEAAKKLELSSEADYSGYKLHEWKEDVEGKLNALRNLEERKNLVMMETKLEKMLSDEKQVELELDSIADMLLKGK